MSESYKSRQTYSDLGVLFWSEFGDEDEDKSHDKDADSCVDDQSVDQHATSHRREKSTASGHVIIDCTQLHRLVESEGAGKKWEILKIKRNTENKTVGWRRGRRCMMFRDS